MELFGAKLLQGVNKGAGAVGRPFVLRAYDTRMCPTSRPPSLYLRGEGAAAMFRFKEEEANQEANFGIDIEPDN
jgi:hypothetical protein